MKVRELFQSVGITQSASGKAPWLDNDNCQIENKTKNDDSVMLVVKRKSDSAEGHAYLRVQDKFKNKTPQLLDWVVNNNEIIGLTLNQLVNKEVILE